VVELLTFLLCIVEARLFLRERVTCRTGHKVPAEKAKVDRDYIAVMVCYILQIRDSSSCIDVSVDPHELLEYIVFVSCSSCNT
jgi:hypothetical protein